MHHCAAAATLRSPRGGGGKIAFVFPIRAAVHTGHGGGLDRSRVVAQRGTMLPGTAVAPNADSLKQEVG
jgi:hypothetical protein